MPPGGCRGHLEVVGPQRGSKCHQEYLDATRRLYMPPGAKEAIRRL